MTVTQRQWSSPLLLTALTALPIAAVAIDFFAIDVEGVRLGMDTREAGAALDHADYEQIKQTSFQKKDREGMHYVGLKLNPGGEVISVEVAHFLNEKFDPNVKRDAWAAEWGKPDQQQGNAGHNWQLTYEDDTAVMDLWAKTFPRPELRTRLVSKHQILADRPGHEVSLRVCMALKDKPVSLLNVTDRENLMECLRTGQLRIAVPK